MKTLEMNTKRIKVEKYLHKYPPYHTIPLGVNVSDILRIAKRKGCSPSELKLEDIGTTYK